MDRSNVINLRPRCPGPFDVEQVETAPVELSEFGWSLVVQTLRQSPRPEVLDLAEDITRQVRAHQSKRLHPARRGSDR